MNLPIPAFRSFFLCSFAAGALSPLALAVDPGWWTARGVVSGTADDYSKLNVGQLKNMAAKARDEMNANLANGAGTAINNLVTGWTNTTNADDYAICNLGQLKAVATPFWDRLIFEHRAIAYPWTTTLADDDNFAAANLGQLKAVFTFNPANPDQDGDGLTDAQEYLIGTNPLATDTDGDHVLDGVDAFPTDPTRTLPPLQITLLGPQ